LLTARGDAVIERFDAMQTSTEEGAPKLSPARYNELRAALVSAQVELSAATGAESSE
jgi:hypothetical protein